MAGEARPKVLDKLNIEVKDFAPDASFPVSLSADIQGGGDVKLDGKAGPIDTSDASETPFDVTLKLNKLDIAKAGFVRPVHRVWRAAFDRRERRLHRPRCCT